MQTEVKTELNVFAKSGREDLALVYLANFNDKSDKCIEFVESLEPGISRQKKWVLVISTLFGCPVKCSMCDAGILYNGKLSKEELLCQIDYLITKRYPDRNIPVEKFKIQFARMGEPSLNSNVLTVLNELPKIYTAPGLMPCISTIAPLNKESFFNELIRIKEKHYSNGRFQMQFSIHSTDKDQREKLIPFKKWDFLQISSFGNKFYKNGDRKIALNFALAENVRIDPDVLVKYFDPEKYILKITPVNPTYSAVKNSLGSYINGDNSEENQIIDKLKSAGYNTILSIGPLDENNIGSNCGQNLMKHLSSKKNIPDSYNYEIKEIV